MKRCFQLAKLGANSVRPNPCVGAILAHNNEILGEGYHQFFGGPHAEVNCINSVKKKDRNKIPDSTLYVSLEPCNIAGKTPACTDLILKENIKKVVISTTDPNPNINGAGIKQLMEKGVKIMSGVLAEEGEELIQVFKTNHLYKRPYIILKVVKSKHNYIGKKGERVWLSNTYSTILSHKWRSEVDGILVGTETVLNDDPVLDTRHYPGNSSIPVFLDRLGKINNSFRLLQGKKRAIAVCEKKSSRKNVEELLLDFDQPEFINNMMSSLFNKGIYVLLVEGGAKTIRSFLDAGLWDEARIINTSHPLSEGIKAPNIIGKLHEKSAIGEDELFIIKKV